MKRILLYTVLAAMTVVACAATVRAAQLKSMETPVGRIEYTMGLPTKESVAKLYDQLDFQRACQAYMWGLPIVGFAEWQYSAAKDLGAGDLDYVIYATFEDKLGILTPAASSRYVIAFSDLAKTGPLVIEVPPGPSSGGILDFWQRPITDTGLIGPDKGKGGKYLVLPPDAPGIEPKGYLVLRSPTFNIFFGHLSLYQDPAQAEAWTRQLRVYPYAERDNPPATRLLKPEGRTWSQIPPRGMAYWERLADILNRESVAERDRFFMAMLLPLGIEKGKTFKPDGRQKRILEEGAVVGEAMAQSLSFAKRTPDSLYRPDSNWRIAIMLDPGQESKYSSQLDERTDYFYQAVVTGKNMVSRTPGVGQAYLEAYECGNDGSRLDGSRTYRLRVPPDAPARQAWTITLYDADTRSFIVTREKTVALSSLMDLTRNADGSVDIYMGPKPPKGFEKNWLPTTPGRGWFAVFRLYGPTEAYFNRSWPLPPIERVK